jgi:PD-(D/E)XK endonuclease
MGLFGPKRDPKKVGEHSEQVIIARLMEVGYSVLVPVGEHHRYDLVIEDADGQFWRVQCKTGWLTEDGGAIRFATASSHYHYKSGRTTNSKRDYRGQIEYFAVYCPDKRAVYLVPIDQVGTTQAFLRLTATKNKQEKNVRWAKDYEL